MNHRSQAHAFAGLAVQSNHALGSWLNFPNEGYYLRATAVPRKTLDSDHVEFDFHGLYHAGRKNGAKAIWINAS